MDTCVCARARLCFVICIVQRRKRALSLSTCSCSGIRSLCSHNCRGDNGRFDAIDVVRQDSSLVNSGRSWLQINDRSSLATRPVCVVLSRRHAVCFIVKCIYFAFLPPRYMINRFYVSNVLCYTKLFHTTAIFRIFLEWAIAIRCNQNIYFIEFCFLHFSYTSLSNLTFRRSYDEIYYLNQARKFSILFLTYKASYYELPPLVWASLNTLYGMSRRHSSAPRSSPEHRDVTEVSRRNHFLQVDIHHVSPHITSSLLHGPLEAKSQLDTVHPRYKVSSKLFRKIVK